ncbi:MAG: SdpI family protein [Capsulimonadaceae bacterium]
MLTLFFTYLGTGILSIIVGIPLMQRRIKRNPWYGVRLPKTLADDRIWYEANAYGGRALCIAGIIQTAASIAFYLFCQHTGSVLLYVTACPIIVLVVWVVCVSSMMKYVNRL